MGNKYSINDIHKLKDSKIFFDANVLIYIYWTFNGDKTEEKYASIFNELRKQNNELYVHFIVLSEIVNRVHKIDYNNYLQNNSINSKDFSYKKYRDSNEGKQALDDIYVLIKDLFKYFNVIKQSFSEIDIQSFLVVDSLDFSDKAIVLICQTNNFILVTHDIDYKNSGIDILTAHQKMLKK